jgi:transcriptional regulator with XRE-family HTH domain
MPKITLKAARVNAGLSQIEAAKKLNVAVSTLRNWEAGKTYPKQPHIEKMCDVYQIDFDALFFA